MNYICITYILKINIYRTYDPFRLVELGLTPSKACLEKNSSTTFGAMLSAY